ncbi:ferredoxin [Streptomyces sp. NPDC002870]
MGRRRRGAADGRVLLPDAEPPPGQYAAARQAADICPSGAITALS